MTTREFLEQAWQIEGRIGCMREEQARLRAMLDAGGKADRRGGAPSEAEKAVTAMNKAIEAEVLALCRVKREVNAAIEAVGDVRLRRLLELRYRSYMLWEDVAQEMGYDPRHIYRMHRLALRCVDREQKNYFGA